MDIKRGIKKLKSSYSSRNRWIKIALKITGILFGTIVLLWLGIAAYVSTHKKQLLESITVQLNEDLKGKLSIESMEPSLIRGFPGISISLKNVLLKDSLWDKHHHDVLRAKDAYVAVNAFSILTGNPTIKDISLNDGRIYLFTDSNGYSNTDLFRKNTSQGKGGGGRQKIKQIYLNKMSVIIENRVNHNFFNFSVRNSIGKIDYNSSGWAATVSIHTLVNSLAFKTQKGSFLENKNLNADLTMKFNEVSEMLTVPMQDIEIEGDELELGGKFSFAHNKSDFNLEVKVSDITFKNASSLLPKNISSKLQSYDLKTPFSAQANIRGRLKNGGNPLIKVYCQVKNNTLMVNGESIENCTFNGVYNNEVVAGKEFTDQNSAISLYLMKGIWSGIPFKADSVSITDLKLPVLAGKFVANFPLTKLNSALGDHIFSFNSGTASLNLLYQAPFNHEDQSKRFINGTIQITNASATYRPRNLSFKNVKAELYFTGRDLFLQNIQVQSNSSLLQMEGSIKNFSNFYYTEPQKLLLDWHIKSPQINLAEFLAFLGKRKNASGNTKMSMISKQTDRMLEQGSVHMQLKVDRLLYKKFASSNVNSDITLRQAGITLKNVSLSHAGGSLQLDGNIDQSGTVNQIKINTHIVNANVQQLFNAFNNFGQSTITDQNLKGSLDATTSVSASIKDNGEVVPRSFRGTVNFNLRNGALINFEPMLKLGAFAFPNRNFSNITLKDLKNRLNIQGNTVIIPPMQIESSVLNVFLEGVYGFSSGTNIALQIPLRNPKKDEFIFDEAEKEKRSKQGIVINVRAVDGDDGKVKFKLGK